MEICVQVSYWGVLSETTLSEWGKQDRQREKLNCNALPTEASALKLGWPSIDVSRWDKGASQAFGPSCQLDPSRPARGITLNETAPFGRGQFLSKETQLEPSHQQTTLFQQPRKWMPQSCRRTLGRTPQYLLQSTSCARRFTFHYNEFISVEAPPPGCRRTLGKPKINDTNYSPHSYSWS